MTSSFTHDRFELVRNRAVDLALKGDVEALMQGSLRTDKLMCAVVESGLRTERRMSHCLVTRGTLRVGASGHARIAVEPTNEEWIAASPARAAVR